MTAITTLTVDLRCGDCLAIMAAMPEKSVDMVFCSPPYEAARTYGINFNLRGQEWVDWAVERFVAGLRVSRGLVAWVIEGQTRAYRWSAVPALFMADLHRRGVHLRKPPIFARVGIPGSGGPDWLRNDYEFIVCGTSGGKLPWSDNTAMGHRPKWGPGGEMSNRLSDGTRVSQWGKTGSPRGMGNKNKHGVVEKSSRPSHVTTTIGETVGGPWWGMEIDADLPMPGTTFGNRPSKTPPHANGAAKGVYFNGKGHPGNRLGTGQNLKGSTQSPAPVLANPGNIIKCLVGGGVMGDNFAHKNEAPFPESLAGFFVRSFCPPGGTVLDCFCGSGTTLKVAAIHGRNAIGIDIRESQVALTERRVRAATDGNLLAPINIRRAGGLA